MNFWRSHWISSCVNPNPFWAKSTQYSTIFFSFSVSKIQFLPEDGSIDFVFFFGIDIFLVSSWYWYSPWYFFSLWYWLMTIYSLQQSHFIVLLLISLCTCSFLSSTSYKALKKKYRLKKGILKSHPFFWFVKINFLIFFTLQKYVRAYWENSSILNPANDVPTQDIERNWLDAKVNILKKMRSDHIALFLSRLDHYC